MKRNRLFAGALALAMTAVTVCSPISASNVKAAEVTDKPNFDFKITGDYTEKKISEADANVINKAFGYDSGSNTVSICSADAKGYIDWENSAIKSWQVYQTEVFQPVLSQDANGNLTVATDENGEVQKKWSTYATYGTERADVISHRTEDAEEIKHRYFGASGQLPFVSWTYYMTNEELNQFGQSIDYEAISDCTDWYITGIRGYEGVDYVLSENHFCLSAECDKHIQTINSHLGLTKLTTWKALSMEEQMQEFYVSEQTQITDAYVIRIYYTADDIAMNWIRRCELRDGVIIKAVTVSDVYGTVHCEETDALHYFNTIPITTEERGFRFTDIWILPEGVEGDTVLTLEDVSSDDTPDTPNTPDTPSEGYVVDYSNAASQTVTKEDFSAMLEANKESDVVIKSNNGVTFTFAKGTMTEVDGKESYDFSTSIIDTYSDSMPSYIQKSSFVSQINFNYSGKLPAKANIRFYVGTEYAGKTLYYSLMNEDNTFAVVNTYVVDAEGYITVQQDHCSNYVVTTTQPQQEAHNGNDTNTPSTDNGNDNTNTTKPSDNNATSPKTRDTTNSFLIIMIMIFSAGAVVYFVKKYKTA